MKIWSTISFESIIRENVRWNFHEKGVKLKINNLQSVGDEYYFQKEEK